jgi:hypothetical protein
LGDTGLVRARELLKGVNGRGFDSRTQRTTTVFERACDVLARDEGKDLRDFWKSIDEVCEYTADGDPDDLAVAMLMKAVWRVLREQRESGVLQQLDRLLLPPEEFERQVNEIMSKEGVAYRLRDGVWVLWGVHEAEVLRRILLRGDEDAAGCRQGDPQVEIVVSTIQDRLRAPGSVLVDYGAGLGRVLAGLAQAERFRTAKYVAVQTPMPDEVRSLASTTGASADFLDREAFLATDVTADVIMVVNTLHHMPFSDIPRQMSALFARLRSARTDGERPGVLLIHEMGELRDPEQQNVPWRAEDLWKLFDGPCFLLNPRTTVSRSGIQLSNVLVEARAPAEDVGLALEANARSVWAQMKERALADVKRLYDARDESDHVELEHSLIINANLDLNRPG